MPDDSLEQYTPEQLADMGKTYAALVKDPNTREMTLRATKKIAPGVSIPEIDVLDRVSAAVKPYVDRIAAGEARELQRDVKERIATKRAELKDAGHSQAEIDAIEKLMVEKQIPDHKSAAEFYKLQTQSAMPTPSGITPMTLPVDKAAIKTAGGIRKWGQTEAHNAINELRSGRVKVG